MNRHTVFTGATLRRRLPRSAYTTALMLLLTLAGRVSADDDHRVQFHAQGASLENIGKGDREVVLASREPITKAEAIAALDQLVEKLKKLKDNDKIIKADIDAAIDLVPRMKDYVNRAGRQGTATGRSHSEEREKIRVDCEAIRGYVLVDNLPHSFEFRVTGWDKDVTRRWSNNDSPGRRVGRAEFEELKAEMFKRWELDPGKANELKVRVALATWKDLRDYLENDVMRNGLIDGDAKSKSVDKEEADGDKKEKLTLRFEVRMLTGIGFVEDD